MTAPRQVVPGTTYLVTRRCLQRELLLRPGQLVNQIFGYVLALAALRYGVQVHAYCVLSNHFHLVVTDPDARLPAFQQYLDAFVARTVNAHLGRRETFWAPKSFSAVSLGTAFDAVAKTAYTLANPVAAGLVQAGHLWPGLWSKPTSFGTTIRVKRPDFFFDPEGDLPDVAELDLVAPPGFDSPAAFRDQVQAELARQEQAARREVSAFLGAERVLSQRTTARPASGPFRRGLSPRVASRDKWKRIELLQRLKGFLTQYREALERRRGGDLAAVFPYGTYLMRVAHGVTCASTA